MGDQQSPDDANKSVTRSPARDGAVSELVIGVPAFLPISERRFRPAAMASCLGGPPANVAVTMASFDPASLAGLSTGGAIGPNDMAYRFRLVGRKSPTVSAPNGLGG